MQRSDQQPVIDEAGIVVARPAHQDAVEVAASRCQPCAADAERFEHEARESVADRLAGGLLDELADEQISDVGVAEPFTRRRDEHVGLAALEEFVTGQASSRRATASW